MSGGLESSELTARMVGIGMNFAAEPQVGADIETTLLHASELGMDEGELRVLSVLTTWLGVHHAHVNADRMVRLVGESPSPRVRAYWASVAAWLEKDRRFARLASGYDGAAVDLLPVGTDFQLKRRGEDERFAGTKVRVPRGTLRDRAQDVLMPEALVGRHAGYRNRVLMGPSWRADAWTVLEQAAGPVDCRGGAQGVVLVRHRVAGGAGLQAAASGEGRSSTGGAVTGLKRPVTDSSATAR